jgi:hypothetical protein
VKSNLKSRGRSDDEKQLIDEGWGGTMTEEQCDKCKFLERQAKAVGIDRKTHFREHQIDKVE